MVFTTWRVLTTETVAEMEVVIADVAWYDSCVCCQLGLVGDQVIYQRWIQSGVSRSRDQLRQ